jgi:beta-lactam-binding protein with PASTA domain
MRVAVLLFLAAILAACGGRERETAIVPDIRGLELEAAQQVLLDAGLVHERLSCPNVPEPAVVAQRPAAGTKVPVGTFVAIRMEQMHGSGVAPPIGGWPHCDTAGFEP